MTDEAFRTEITAMLGDEAPAFFASQAQPPVRALRFRPGQYVDMPGISDRKVPWLADMRYLPPMSPAGKDPLHEAGAYYIQEPSAAVPAIVLDPKPGMLVLDLCAAPGGKTTQLALSRPDMTLVSNEINPKRAQILSLNVERMGCANTAVISETPERLAGLWRNVFDAVLVDAPCSGEGMFRKDEQAAAVWSKEAVEGCARRQEVILKCAAEMLKPGGTLVYSTCTFNRRENDFQIESFLRQYADFEPEAFKLSSVGEVPDGMLHLWPHRFECEGHFVAKLRRKGTAEAPVLPQRGGLQAAERQEVRKAEALLESVADAPPFVSCSFRSALWHLPERLPDLTRVRILRPGLMLTETQGTQLRPAHALSHAAKAKRRFEASREEAYRYLHGEAITDQSLEDGWCAVCYGGYTLGWGKKSQMMIKNHYPRGLRK